MAFQTQARSFGQRSALRFAAISTTVQVSIDGLLERPVFGTLSRGRVGPDAIFILMGCLILAVAWARLAFGSVSLLIFQDAAEQTYSWWQYAVSELHAGRFPVWDPFTFAGRTNVGEGQEGVFYPVFLLFAVGTGDWAQSISAIHLFAFLHALIAFAGAYLLGRVLGMRGLASLGCGLVYSLGGFFSSRALGQLNIFDATAWVPYVPAGIFLVARTRQLRWSVLSGAALGLSVLAGHPQPGLHTTLIATLAVAFLCCIQPRLSLRMGLISLAIMGATGVALAAVQLLPTLEYQPLALRWVGGSEPIPANARIPLDIVATNPSLDLRKLPSVVLAGTQIPDGGLFIGVAALASAVIGTVFQGSPTRFFWIGVLGLGIAASTGPATPLFAIVFSIPVVDQIREPVRYLLLAHLSLAVLAGYGLDFLMRNRRLIVVAVALLAVASIQLGVVWAASMPSRAGYNASSNREPLQYYSSTEADGLAEFLARQPGLFRIDLADSPLPRNYGELLRIPTVGGYRATSPTPVQRLREKLGFLPPDRGPDLLGERYIVSARPLDGVRAVGRAGSLMIFENPRALPLVWLTSEVRLVADDQQALVALADSSLDPAQVAVVEQRDAWQMPSSPPGSGGDAAIESFLPEQVRIRTQTSAATLLVTSFAAYPGWVAAVDGQAWNLLTVDYAFQGVVVPAGEHTIELSYWPLSIFIGAGISLAVLVAIIGGLGWVTLRR